MSKRFRCFLTAIFIFLLTSKNSAFSQKYQPRYWLEGVNDRGGTQASASALIDSFYKKGWRGIWYWGADREGGKMMYHFASPFLETQPWAVSQQRSLPFLIKAAHYKGMKVMVNIEDVNPYHWKENHWSPSNIALVAADLAATGVDGVFEECFEVKPEVFSALAATLKSKGIEYISGTDPMLLRDPVFAAMWSQTGSVNIYNYYLKRDRIYRGAALLQHGSLGYGWAKYWNKPTSFISPVNRNWGIAPEDAPAVIRYLCIVRALQFRVDNFVIFGGANVFDPLLTQSWIKKYVDKQESRPTLNIVVLPDKEEDSVSRRAWNNLFNSGDAITSGAFNGGYNVVVSDEPVNADAYWIYTSGKEKKLPGAVVALFKSDKKVFLQAGTGFPSGAGIDATWRSVLDRCGIDASVPLAADVNIPYTGYYRDTYFRFTGSDAQLGTDLCKGTVFPKRAVTGTVVSTPNTTYGRGPFMVGKNSKYILAASALDWQAAYPISHLLSNGGVMPSSNVWGIAGKNVSAFLAVEATEMELVIPGLAEGAELHVVVLDRNQHKKMEKTVTYKAPFRLPMSEYDFLLIDIVK